MAEGVHGPVDGGDAEQVVLGVVERVRAGDADLLGRAVEAVGLGPDRTVRGERGVPERPIARIIADIALASGIGAPSTMRQRRRWPPPWLWSSKLTLRLTPSENRPKKRPSGVLKLA